MEQFFAVILYFGAYVGAFFVMKSLMMNNSLMGKIQQAASGFGKNFRANQAKKRAEIRGGNMAKMKAGNRFADSNPLARGFNTATIAAGTGVRGRFGLGKRGAEAMDQARRLGADDFLKSPGGIVLRDDDNALRAMTYGSATEAREGVSQWLQSAKGMSKVNADAEANRATDAVQARASFGRAQQVAAVQAMTNTGTAFSDVDDISSTIARAAGGNGTTAASLGGYVNAIAKQKGRHDWAPGAGSLISATHEKMGLRDASGAAIKGPGRKALIESSWNSGSLYQLANGKPAGTETMTDQWVNEYRDALASGDMDKTIKATTAMKEMQAMLPNATGDNQKVLNAALARMNADRENHIRSSSGFLAPGTAGPKAPTQLNFERMEEMASRQARTYERPDINNLGP